MKKWLLIVIGVVALSVLAAYVIIPRKLTILTVAVIRANPYGSSRCLANGTTWKSIFGSEASENGFTYNKTTFTINKKLPDGVEVLMNRNGILDSSLIEIMRLNYDSSMIRWTSAVGISSNPFKKFEQYLAANTMKNTMMSALDTIKRFLEKGENVYGISIDRAIVKDTLLIVTRDIFNNYPSTRDVYSLISRLHDYARMNVAKQAGYPMLDIKTSDSINFETMVALPVNKELKDAGAILHKEMVPGNILVTEVKGGPYTVSKAFNSLRDYVTDHDLQSPAIPFQSLITDRLSEPDTTNWVTKIYYPIY